MKRKQLGNPRDAALFVLMDVDKNQAYSNLLLTKHMNQHKIAGIDKGLMTELTYGTLQHKMTLDFFLAPFIKGKLENWVQWVLRMAVYQIHYLDRIPNHAVVNEAVQLAKYHGHKGVSGLVNGVLRAFLREGAPSFDSIKDPLERLSIETSHPEWMLENWIQAFGFEKTEQIARQNNVAPPQTIRVNTMKISIDDAIQALESEGFTVRKGILPESLHVAGKTAATSALFASGQFTIQDESSMMPAHALQLEKGMSVLDMCAAPGGKTTHIAQLLANTGHITALDLHENKLKYIHENAERLGFTHISTVAADARQAQEVLEQKQFDRILVDAPCSGYGVIRRKPDMKYAKKPQDAERLATIQLAILNEAYSLLSPGGILVYSTCTIEPTENDEVIDAFLQLHQDMQELSLPDVFTALPHGAAKVGHQVLPYPDGDGFYVVALQKA
ncbi:16S rRNA (cytosine967-C5)-methyltransferase [Chryseomicrobium aureum]|uniref:16S rRNA (cytosine(967)-C(5))-methyltransferase RsmB n=1 Tax=Chryseomicrobium aureum TaxID=1441723 RepID=UPI001956756D|nr:16S rRNA (cytosine(967)-C(5))-methyltransferase RsmB [Chryseomicrobium aureum]MBM7705361.1 16S rRNA (cytosine967-C5)-methyltransferase [Chryseomicrobium aureum]